MQISSRARKIIADDALICAEHDILEALTITVEEQSSQRKVAADLGVSAVYLGDVLHGRRGVGAGLAEKLGWDKVTVFVRRKG